MRYLDNVWQVYKKVKIIKIWTGLSADNRSNWSKFNYTASDHATQTVVGLHRVLARRQQFPYAVRHEIACLSKFSTESFYRNFISTSCVNNADISYYCARQNSRLIKNNFRKRNQISFLENSRLLIGRFQAIRVLKKCCPDHYWRFYYHLILWIAFFAETTDVNDKHLSIPHANA